MYAKDILDKVWVWKENWINNKTIWIITEKTLKKYTSDAVADATIAWKSSLWVETREIESTMQP